MLDGILGRGFSAKCKSLMKTTRSRIDVVRRRAEAKQKFLNEDLAKLLSNGLDINAYGRTEEFLAGMNLLWSYDFVEQSCEYIAKQLSRMQKQGECPEECREAVASLMYAAARFSDLPELRELRDTFQERYGSSIEAFVSQKLIEKMSTKPPPKEKRLQVLQDIASKFSIRWDSRGFERRMATPAIVAQVDEQRVDIAKQRQGPQVEKIKVRTYEEGNNIQKRNEVDNRVSRRKEATEYKEKPNLKSGGSSSQGDDNLLYHGRPVFTESKHSYPIERVHNYEEGNIQKRNEGDNHKSRRKEAIENREKPLLKSGGSSSQGDDNLLSRGRPVCIESKHAYPMEKVQDNNFHAKHRPVFIESKHAYPMEKVQDNNVHAKHRPVFIESKHAYPTEKVQDDNVHGKQSYGIRTPRIGEITEGLSRDKADLGKTRTAVPYNNFNQDNALSSIKKEVNEGSDRLKSALPPPYIKSNQSTPRPPPYIKPEEAKHNISRDSKHVGLHNEADHHDSEEPSAKLRSYGHEKEPDYSNDKFPLPKPRSHRRKPHKSSSSSHKAVEDVKMSSSSSRRKDHSKKGLQILFDEEHHVRDDEERMIDKLLIHYSKKPSNFDAGKMRKKSREGEESSHDHSRNGSGPARSVSLPNQQTASPESNKVFARSNTFQEDNQAPHVHPKLPNYDDLAARFAALKGR